MFSQSLLQKMDRRKNVKNGTVLHLFTFVAPFCWCSPDLYSKLDSKVGVRSWYNEGQVINKPYNWTWTPGFAVQNVLAAHKPGSWKYFQNISVLFLIPIVDICVRVYTKEYTVCSMRNFLGLFKDSPSRWKGNTRGHFCTSDRLEELSSKKVFF